MPADPLLAIVPSASTMRRNAARASGCPRWNTADPCTQSAHALGSSVSGSSALPHRTAPSALRALGFKCFNFGREQKDFARRRGRSG
jgi:hypothetical protein